ncbi:uncharacterized protein TrAtP1_009010 [Trichoderma atroviride]|uniref:uncharacterized protein n=1 Tax=Hypocrea atroviridis TaxID=63577 RepID=UPI003321B54E|nr:hypothetical protein TrAtP1_009010 [Trichoderma atroviride]
MASSNFNFKLDPACLPQLTSKGDNYSEWRTAWQIAYEWAELWDTIEEKPPTLPNKRVLWRSRSTS